MARRTRRARYRGYAEEAGVDPARGTETFAEVLLDVDTPRWAGAQFRLRAGKALSRRFKGVVLHRRAGGTQRVACEGERRYRRVLLDVLGGGNALAVRAEEAEEAWRIVMPVLDAWAAGEVPLEDYAAGRRGRRGSRGRPAQVSCTRCWGSRRSRRTARRARIPPGRRGAAPARTWAPRPSPN